MIRVTFELLPGGDASRARTIGLMEICNIGVNGELGEYAVVLKKTPPFNGCLKQAWRKGLLSTGSATVDGARPGEDEEAIIARVSGHHRSRRGIYDLAYSALVACGLGKRNPNARAP